MDLKLYLRPVRAIVFDLDGVIINSTQPALDALQQAAENRGLTIPTIREMRLHWGHTWPYVVKKLWPGISEENSKRLRQEMIRLAVSKKYKPFEGLLPALDQLTLKKIKLALLTNRTRATFNCMQEPELVLSYFRPIATPDGTVSKPDPGAFDVCLNYFANCKINKEQVLFVGDTLCDLETAKAADIRFVGVLTGACNKETFESHNAKYHLECATHLSDFF